MQRRAICFRRAKLRSLCWRRIQRARGKKSVILALRYFIAAAGDALTVFLIVCRLVRFKLQLDLLPLCYCRLVKV
jgi:hypothetical protein